MNERVIYVDEPTIFESEDAVIDVIEYPVSIVTVKSEVTSSIP